MRKQHRASNILEVSLWLAPDLSSYSQGQDCEYEGWERVLASAFWTLTGLLPTGFQLTHLIQHMLPRRFHLHLCLGYTASAPCTVT